MTPPDPDPVQLDPDQPDPDRPGRPEILVDATGLRCPLPIIRLAAAARDAPPGTTITLLSTDPAAEPDVAAWCRMRTATLLTQTWSAGTLTSRLTTRSA